MFDPVEFIVLAGQLAAGSATVGAAASPHSSARVRTAYSRAYYGLYLTVRGEIASRHGLHHRQLNHGALYTHLQSPRASKSVRRLGRELQRLYTLRQTADYELAPREPWRTDLDNVNLAATLALRALALSRTVRQLDFSPVVPLFSRT
jgi:hypothetical protein